MKHVRSETVMKRINFLTIRVRLNSFCFMRILVQRFPNDGLQNVARYIPFPIKLHIKL